MSYRLPARARTAAALISALVLLLGGLSAALDPPNASAAASQLKRYPYLTDLVTNNATVNWATDRSQATGSVKYGVAPNCTTTTLAAVRASITVGTVAEYQWKANVSGLSANTQYCYRAYLGATDILATDPSPTFTSQIAAGSATPYSFAVFGDWGAVDANGNNPDQANLMQLIASSGVRFAVTTGDTGYPGGTETTYGDLQQKGADTSAIFGPAFWAVPGRSIPLFNTSGNHGFNSVGLTNWPQDRARTTSSGRYQLDTYCCTNGTSSASYPSAWYAFDAGSARFYVLTAAWSDSNVGTATAYKNDTDNHWTPSSAEYQWLKQDLESHPGGVKFAFEHYPMYSDNATEASDLYLRGAGSLEGLLAANGVSIGFSGHAHMYERNLKPTGGIATYLTGGGGAKVEPIGGKGCSTIDAYGIGWSYSGSKGSKCGAATVPTSLSQVFHFLKVSVNGSSVTVTPTNSLGQTFDVQTYSFGAGGDSESPSNPTNLTATATSATRVDLAWTAATDNVGVTAYDVYRDGTRLASLGTVTAYADTSAAPSTTYAYTLKARDAAGNTSGPSNSAAITTPAPDPTLIFAPTDDTYVQASAPDATAGSSSTIQVDNSPVKHILLKFVVNGLVGRQVTGATLRLYDSDPSPKGGDFYSAATDTWTQATATWNNAPPTSGPLIASLGSVAINNWYDVDLSSIITGDRTVSLRVTSTSTDGAIYTSNNGAVGFRPQLVVSYRGSAPPAAPTGLTATPTSGDAPVALSWTASSDPVTGYTVKRSTTPTGTLTTVATTTGAISASDATALSGQTYYYVVTATGTGGESGNSNQTSATLRPAAPAGLMAIPGLGQVTLSWTAASGATSYSVKRGTNLGGPYPTTVATPTATTYTDSGLTNGTTYYYVVTASNAGGESVVSSEVSATPTSRSFVFSDGFETGDLSKWTTKGGLTVVSSNPTPHTGTWEAQGTTTNGATYAKKLFATTYTDGYFRSYVYLAAGYTSQVNVLRYRTAADVSLGYLFVTTTGQLALRNDVGAVTTTSTTTFTTGSWHSLELHLLVNGTTSSTEVWLDGTKVNDLSLTNQNWGSTPIGKVQIGEVQTGRTYSVSFDDVAFDTQRVGQ